jgi:hypothetical protein
VAAIDSQGKSPNLPALAGKFRQYLRSPSTRLALVVALVSYLSYAYAHISWTNPALISVSIFTGVFLPSYAKLSNKAELWANNRFGFVTAGRLGRFAPQYAFNLAVFWIMYWGGALNREGIASVGGFAAAALLTSLASQGVQYISLFLFQRGIGDANRNVLVNPFHNTHLAIIKRAIEERGLDKVIVHPTLIPRLHADALRKGQIRVARLENGFQIYEATDKADLNVDYFPAGKQFLPPETRRALIELAVAEAGLGDKVEVVFYREIYDTKGFQGVIAEVKRRYPGVRLHGLHGTDAGGMTVRGIYDECGWIYPWRILRRDTVSATAIRRGAKGMTSTVVTDVLGQLTANLQVVTAGGRRFRNDNGVLIEGD